MSRKPASRMPPQLESALVTSAYRDGSGRALTDYPRPSVAVDTALLTLEEDAGGGAFLAVLQVRRPEGHGWALPGTFLHEGERLIDAVLRSLRQKAAVSGVHPRQLHVFDDPHRDDRGWVLSVAHVDVVPVPRLDGRDATRTRLAPADRPGRLPYDHAQIVALAVGDLRARYEKDADPDHLLTEPFTVGELRRLHESVRGRPLQRDSFKRWVVPLLEPTGHVAPRRPGRPAELYRRASASTAS
jgi:8-oxo-dGTP diphosphatase